jgi:hypothetical protein
MSTESSQAQPASPNSSKSWFDTVAFQVPRLAQGLGLFAVVLYVFGYIIVNMYFARYGIVSKGPLNQSYLSAGLTFVLILGLFFVTVGLKVHRMDEDGKALRGYKPQWLRSSFWWVIILTCLLARIALAITFITSVVMLTFLRGSAAWLLPALGAYVAIDYPLTLFKLYARFPISGTLFSSTLYIVLIWFAASRAHNRDFTFLFWVFTILAMMLLMELEFDKMFQSRSATRFLVAVSASILLAISYGEMVYEKIPQSAGGGKPLTVQLLISPQGASAIVQFMKVQSSLSEEVQLLSEDADEFVVLSNSSDGAVHPIRLSKRLVDGVLPKTAARPSEK